MSSYFTFFQVDKTKDIIGPNLDFERLGERLEYTKCCKGVFRLKALNAMNATRIQTKSM